MFKILKIFKKQNTNHLGTLVIMNLSLILCAYPVLPAVEKASVADYRPMSVEVVPSLCAIYLCSVTRYILSSRTSEGLQSQNA